MRKENKGEMRGNFVSDKKKTIQITVWPSKHNPQYNNFVIRNSYKKKGSEEWVRQDISLSYKEDLIALRDLLDEVVNTDLGVDYVAQSTDKPEPKQQKFIEPTHAAAVADDDIPF